MRNTTTPRQIERIEHSTRPTPAITSLTPFDHKPLIERLPESPGVYLLYGSAGELLYVGRSKHIRTRVRSHFSSGSEARMCRRVRHIDARRTAGELGSSLLESRLIKQLRPMYNIMAREKRTLVLARRTLTREGYSSVLLEAIDHLAPSAISSFMGLFKSKIRAREVLATISKTFRLCPKLLGIESTRRHCFSYHLGVCNGACMGEEDRLLYNTRFEQAFADRRFKAWPYEGGLIIEEHAVDDMRREMFLVDHWCLLSSVTCREDAGIPGTQRFDYDIYKILSRYIFDDANRANIVHISRREVEMLIREPILPGALVPVQEAHRTS